ncbi:MAG: DUF3592 domain-containing protein [Ignavibacteria bacterium]|nr:DUF3592 domain-containing protein [Ignavibacteria bacterium]
MSLVAFSFIAISGYNMYRGYKSSTWPSVRGNILKSEISERRYSGTKSSGRKTEYHASVDYQYEVIGKMYFSNSISYKASKTSYSAAMIELQKYPENSGHVVYYNPENPEESVLDPGMGTLNLIFIGLPLIVWLLFFFGLRRGKVQVVKRDSTTDRL